MNDGTSQAAQARISQEQIDAGRRGYELDRKHVFHSWSAQEKLTPMTILDAEGSWMWDGEGNSLGLSRRGAREGFKCTRVPLRQGKIGLAKVLSTESRGHLVSEAYPGHWRMKVSADGQGVVSHAGVGMLRELAERTGLVAGLSKPLLASYKGPPIHQPGQVLTDLAVAVADGAISISGVQTLTDRQDVFGPVASMPTAW